jgi:hypothetical protein
MPEGLEDLVQRADQATRAALERMTVRDLAFVAKCGQEPDAPPGAEQRSG